jgi:threonine dehydratase
MLKPEERKTDVEPAGAAGISALLAGKVEIKGGPVCVVVSVYNLDKKYFKEALRLLWKYQLSIFCLLDFSELVIIFIAGRAQKNGNKKEEK